MADVTALTNQVNALLGRIANLETAAAAPQGPPAVTFALNPAHAVTGMINYTESTGIKLYKAATYPLAILFDGTIKTLRPMLNLLERRVDEFNARHLVTIPVVPSTPAGAAATNRDLFTESRLCDLKSIKDHATTCMGTDDKNKQLNSMFATLMFNSMDAEGTMALENSGLDYKVNGSASFAIMVKGIIQLCEVDTFASSFLIREKMALLPQTIEEIKFDIRAFNMHANDLVTKLSLSGEKSDDLFLNVFNSYKKCPDEDFHSEFLAQARKYKDGTLVRNVDNLMSWGLQTYNELNEAQTYGKPTKADQEIIALTAQLQKAEKSNKNIQKQLTQIKKDRKKSSNKKDDDKKKKGGDGKKKFAAPTWPKPTGTESKGPRKFKDEDWYWCPDHDRWVKHPHDKCRIRLKREKENGANQGTPPPGQVSAANALIGMIAEAAQE